MASSVVPQIYVDLARQFVHELIEPNEFMMEILREYKAEKRFFDERTAAALNALFYAAEEYVDDPSRGPDAVDEVGLLTAARDFLRFVEAQS